MKKDVLKFLSVKMLFSYLQLNNLDICKEKFSLMKNIEIKTKTILK